MLDNSAHDLVFLEFAAEASGRRILPEGSIWPSNVKGCYFWIRGVLYSCEEGVNNRWSPLEDDGDAIRLAARLRMDLRITLCCVDALWRHPGDAPCTQRVTTMRYRPDASEAYRQECLRRVIVRAAAMLGGYDGKRRI